MGTIVNEENWDSPEIRTVMQLPVEINREQGSIRLEKRKWFSRICRNKILDEPFESLSSNLRLLDFFEVRTFAVPQDMQRNVFSVITKWIAWSPASLDRHSFCCNSKSIKKKELNYSMFSSSDGKCGSIGDDSVLHSSADEQVGESSTSGVKSETSMFVLLTYKLGNCHPRTAAQPPLEGQRQALFLLQRRLFDTAEHVLEESLKSIVGGIPCWSQVKNDWLPRKSRTRLTLWQDCNELLRYTTVVPVRSKQDKSTLSEVGE